MAEEKDNNQAALETETATESTEEQAKEENKNQETENQTEKKETEAPTENKVENQNSNINPDEIKPGMTVKVHQKIREVNAKGEEKERIQVFEGIVLAKRGKNLENCRILVRKIASNHIGVEKIFPLISPTLAKIEIVKTSKVRRAKLYFLRDYKKRLREKKMV